MYFLPTLWNVCLLCRICSNTRFLLLKRQWIFMHLFKKIVYFLIPKSLWDFLSLFSSFTLGFKFIYIKFQFIASLCFQYYYLFGPGTKPWGPMKTHSLDCYAKEKTTPQITKTFYNHLGLKLQQTVFLKQQS